MIVSAKKATCYQQHVRQRYVVVQNGVRLGRVEYSQGDGWAVTRACCGAAIAPKGRWQYRFDSKDAAIQALLDAPACTEKNCTGGDTFSAGGCRCRLCNPTAEADRLAAETARREAAQEVASRSHHITVSPEANRLLAGLTCQQRNDLITKALLAPTLR